MVEWETTAMGRDSMGMNITETELSGSRLEPQYLGIRTRDITQSHVV